MNCNKHVVFVTVSSSRKRWRGIGEKLVKLWKPLPVSVGLVLLAVLQWRHIQRRKPAGDDTSVVIAKNWEVSTIARMRTFITFFYNLLRKRVKLYFICEWKVYNV